jgi:rubrerythrin
MKKTDLLNSLQESIRTEESATAIYLTHLQALAERTGIDKALVTEARQGLEYLITENKRHQTILEALQKQIKGDERHDW